MELVERGDRWGWSLACACIAPTAPFAVVELGLRATTVGVVVGLAVGAIVMAGRRIKRAP